MKKNISVLVSTFSPWHSANSICISNILNELKNNYSFTIISYSSCDEISDLGKIICQKKPKFTYPKLIRFKKIILRLINKNSLDKEKITFFLDSLIKQNKNIDSIIPVCFPTESLVAALLYKNLNPKTKIIPYLLDQHATSSTAHTFKFLQKLKLKWNLELEKKSLIKSNHILANELWISHINKNIPELSNKLELISYPLIDTSSNSLPVRNKNNIFYAGTLDKKSRDPHFALVTISNALEKLNSHFLEIAHRGNCNALINKFASKSVHIINNGQISSLNASEKIKSAGFLLLIGNQDHRQIPSKLFEYISTGKPIIAFCKSEHDPVIKILEKYPNHCIILESTEKNLATKYIMNFLLSNTNKILEANCIRNSYIESTVEFCASQLKKALDQS